MKTTIDITDERTVCKKCTDCGQSFEYETFTVFGKHYDPECESCDGCDEKRKDRVTLEARKVNAIREWERVVPPTYRETDIKHADYPMPIHKMAMGWSNGQDVMRNPRRPFLGLVGESGRCKTRIMAQVIRQMIWQGCRCEWVNATQFQWCVQHEFNDDDSKSANRHMEKYRTCQILAFDDLGKQKWTDAVESKFYDLLEYRSSNLLSLVWTSNADMEELGAMLSQDRSKPITGRLIDYSNIILV